jgi:hypothetical protein
MSEFIYDGNFLARRNDRLKTGASQGYTVYHYSSTGKLADFEDLDSNGVTLRKTEYMFDTQDKVVTENYYVKVGSTLPLSAHYSYDYYPNGNLQKYTRYNSGSTVMETIYYTDYDANGNNTKGYANDNLGVTVDSFRMTYDDHPNFLRQFNYENSLTKNNKLSSTHKPTVSGIEYTDTYSYSYNSQGYVTYYHEALDGDIYYIDYTCDN